MILEKGHDRGDRKGVCEILKMYGIGGRTLGAGKSFYVGLSVSYSYSPYVIIG